MSWQPAGKLPNPHPRDGIRFRWVRVSALGQSDAGNVSMRLREGWEPVRKEEVPELAGVITDFNTKFPENIEIGGLLLCKTSEENAKAAQKHYEGLARNQLQSSDRNFLREADPRMPVLKPERRTTFGGGGTPR
jgi:hypothetical protein